jgi:UDPglucose 6-dehydrogenase
VLKNSEIIFVPVQTPHDPLYEGITKLPKTTADFNYDYLKSACKTISEELDKIGEDRIVIIISTVLPGTIEREIKPILSKHVKLCYNPFFIAMGTTVHDFLNPEIVLFGVEDKEAAEKAKEFYRTITSKNIPITKRNKFCFVSFWICIIISSHK